jgi:glycosyltransferase involved in cell wall biosynthesis
MVKVSVLVTTYNQERFIGTAVDSALAQQVSFPYEVVVCDDGSTDGTRAILRELAARNPGRIRLFLPEANLGHSGAEIFMRGLAMCQGQYIAPLDGDDHWISPGKLQLQAEFLDARPDCPLCFHNSEVRYEDGSRESWNLYPAPLKERLSIEDLLGVTSIHNSTLMFRREMVSDFQEWRDFAGPLAPTDWTMALAAARHGRVGYIDRVMTVYLQHAAGVWSAVDTAGQLERIIGEYGQMDRFLGGQYHELIEKAVCARSYEAAIERERQGNLPGAARHLARALTGRPEWLENYVPANGLTRGQFWAMLSRRLWLYRHPVLFRMTFWGGFVRARIEWLRIRNTVRLRRYWRLLRTLERGSIRASPNPAPESARHPHLGATTLAWTSSRVPDVEVRIGTPDGLLFAHVGAGAKTTGEWVQDGAIFYLQDVSGGRPLTLANTLDVVRVAIRKRRPWKCWKLVQSDGKRLNIG